MLGGAFAQDTQQKVEPGNAPTQSITKTVPDMKADCPDQAGVDTKAQGTEATEATGAAVPAMKPEDAAKCADAAQKTTN
jgi:hypothetical protein